MKLYILSNINVDFISDILRNDYGYDAVTAPVYNAWVQQILDDNSAIYRENPDVIIIIFDGNELIQDNYAIQGAIDSINDIFEIIKKLIDKNHNKFILISNLDIKQRKILSLKDFRIERQIENYWMSKLDSIKQEYWNVCLLDIKKLVEEYGRKDFYSQKLWYLANERFSPNGSKLIALEINRLTSAWKGKKKKCIILDLDNTLWGGIIGEDGIDGIELSNIKEGSRYHDFQKRLKDMKELGILLAVVSKNNYEDVIEVFKKHPYMVLKEEDFVSMKVNWANKVDNIKSLSDELNLSLDSFVFIDDSPVERESIKKILPEVTVFDFPKDTSELESKIIESYEEYFLSYKTTEEDRERSEMYRSEINRKKIREKVTNLEDFLLSLEMKVSIWKARKLDVERISQLTQRTNQFNLTTRRYSIIDVNKMLEDPNYYLYVASLADKFGNCGIISVIIIKAHGSKAEIDTFLLSCRVMGRYVEDAIIEAVEQRLRENGVNEIYAQYIPTKKNFPVKELIERLGYTLISIKEDGTKDYKLDLSTFPNCRKLLAKVIWHED